MNSEDERENETMETYVTKVIGANYESWMQENPYWDDSRVHYSWALGGTYVEGLPDPSTGYDWQCYDLWENPLFPGKLFGYADGGCSCNSPYDFESGHSKDANNWDMFSTFQEFERWCPQGTDTPSHYGDTYTTMAVSTFKEKARKWFNKR